MKYTNGFTINARGNECFVTFLETRPQAQSQTTEEIDTFVMTEQCARQLIAALAQVYAKIDKDRLDKNEKGVTSETHQLS